MNSPTDFLSELNDSTQFLLHRVEKVTDTVCKNYGALLHPDHGGQLKVKLLEWLDSLSVDCNKMLGLLVSQIDKEKVKSTSLSPEQQQMLLAGRTVRTAIIEVAQVAGDLGAFC